MEKFRRNDDTPFHEDILKRTFDIGDNKIILQFQYGKNDIRPTIRIYTCPPKSDYGCEIPFNEDDNPVDEVYLTNCFSLSFWQRQIYLNRINPSFSHVFHPHLRATNTNEMYRKLNDITCYLSNSVNKMHVSKRLNSDCCTLNQQFANIKIMSNTRF